MTLPPKTLWTIVSSAGRCLLLCTSREEAERYVRRGERIVAYSHPRQVTKRKKDGSK
jgi:hypothetical protein